MKRKFKSRRPAVHVPQVKPRGSAPVTPAAAPKAAAKPALPPLPEELKTVIAEFMLAPEMAGEQPVADGDLAEMRRSLAAQAATLDRLFQHLVTLAAAGHQHSPVYFERYLRLAFKAQAQALRTHQALSRLHPLPERAERARQVEVEKVDDGAETPPPMGSQSAPSAPVVSQPRDRLDDCLPGGSPVDGDAPLPAMEPAGVTVAASPEPRAVNDRAGWPPGWSPNVNGLNLPRRVG